ncbi:MAG: reverse transcriptase family protein [Candidatus Thiodiazotropha endolucinida]|nr:reverse transcriptase family protein [Candidatus Thiodiazotropha taylori]MCW4346728.1 reverse transcriptase family protein [Candidatus Thiodiazotropha endolucinida]
MKYFDSGQQRQCFARYFEDLAIPKDQKYDNVFLELCNMRVSETESGYSGDLNTDLKITESEIGSAIDLLNNGKAPDEYGLSSEHFKAAKPVIVPVLTDLFNQILTEKKVPASFKTGIITPVLKKGKDSKCMGNYRGITISSALGKLFEYTVLNKLKVQQSDHQFGFTKGLSPTMASLLVTEAKSEAHQNHESLYFATLDSVKAFDVVHHVILLDKLIDKGICKDIWLIIKDLYTDISSKVKWLGDCSDAFPINQGVRQGGVLSTHLYKVYVDPLLELLKSKRLGYRLGTVYLGSPTVADDVTFLTKFREELQLMFCEAGSYSSCNRYQIHPMKTEVTSLTDDKADEKDVWSLGDNELALTSSSTHLGLKRLGKKESEKNVNERICLARRTAYLLMNTGLHGTNGLSPKVSYIIYKAYVLPRMLYGLEAIHLNKTQLQQLEKYHLRTLRQLQSLPQRTATSAVFMLLGALPIEAEIHKKQLSLLHSVITSDNKCLQDLVQRQLACSFDNVYSFFYSTAQVLVKYNLPTLNALYASDIGKLQWKAMCKKAVSGYWTRVYVNDIKAKKTLKYLSVCQLRAGSTHLVWQNLESVADVRKAVIKVRFLTGVYLLQTSKHVLSNKTVDATCRLCQLDVEDIRHTVTRCPAFHSIRASTLTKLRDVISDHRDIINVDNWDCFLKIIIDPTWVARVVPEVRDDISATVEEISRTFFFNIHVKRLYILKQLE